ncbi:MAG: hypothetical protein ACR2G4_10845 [Pyrinomonadaceae bacterium]
MLLTDLRALETVAAKLDAPLALATAKAEIASAGWTLDREWAKKLLREAYELTFPPEKEQIKLREKPVGALPTPPTSDDRARSSVRGRVLEVASRDKAFVVELAQSGAEKLGSYETHQRYSALAYQAAMQGDQEAVATYVHKALEADITQAGAYDAINELALKDRAAADSLILQYIDQLRRFPPAFENQGTLRTSFMLHRLVYPNSLFPKHNFPPPGAAVMRAYVMYEVERISKLEQAALFRERLSLLGIWEPLRKYAPELTNPFMELEARSRRPGDNSPLPTKKSIQEQYKESYEKRLKEALDSGEADEMTIHFVLSRGDFDKARKLISKLPDGAQKTQFTEMVNLREATSLAAKGDLAGAESLAEQLTRAVSIVEAYPALINRCGTDRQQPSSCASLLVSKAVRQLKRADATPFMPPAGIPASIVPTGREFDPVLSSLSKFAGLIIAHDETLALEVLDQVVAAANASGMETGQGRTGLELEVFRKLAVRNEVRVRQTAESFKDRLRQIVALAAIYQWKAAELAKALKVAR